MYSARRSTGRTYSEDHRGPDGTEYVHTRIPRLPFDAQAAEANDAVDTRFGTALTSFCDDFIGDDCPTHDSELGSSACCA